MSDAVPMVTLNNQVRIPQLGFGVFQVDPAETGDVVRQALAAGYRHIDTAEMYGNEKGVAEGIGASGLDRSDVWITSKINNNNHGREKTLRAFDQSLADLKVDQIDLMLIHWPLPAAGDFVGTWQALSEMYREGRARTIGVSNFQPAHLERLAQESDVVPVVNQIELHPYLTQESLRAYNAEHQIATEAWSPIAQGGVLDDSVITSLAQKYDRTPAQIVLRWHIQLGNIVFPKTTTPSRMKENLDLFDFELADDDMAAVSGLNKDERTGPDPDEFNSIPD